MESDQPALGQAERDQLTAEFAAEDRPATDLVLPGFVQSAPREDATMTIIPVTPPSRPVERGFSTRQSRPASTRDRRPENPRSDSPATNEALRIHSSVRALLCAASLVLFGGRLVSADPLPTLYLIGDSTVSNGTKGQMGWGKALPAFFDTNRIAIVNRARGGRSSRTFLTEGLWK